MDTDPAVDPDIVPPRAYTLPAAMRSELAGTFGELTDTAGIPALVGEAPVAAVGDIVAMSLHGLGITPQLFVCDFKTQRGDDDPALLATLGTWGDHEIRVANPAATITRDAWLAVRSGWQSGGSTRIVVEGEEDMLGIPAFIEAPLGAKVLYGKPNEGAVVVTIDAEFQTYCRELVSRFDRE